MTDLATRLLEARKQKEINERGIFESVSEQFHG